jgi:tetratricopeptide (TPR) repeat protein
MAALILDLAPTEARDGWQAAWSLNGQPILPSFPVTGPAARAMTSLGQRFLELFEQGVRPLTDPNTLQGIGRQLFETFFQSIWATVQPPGHAGPQTLLIRSQDPQILNLPWELVELAPGLPLGCDAAWSLRRTPLDRLAADRPLEPGPLRILLMTAAPTDQAQLDYEREEDTLLRATGKLRQGVILHFAETGGLDELATLVAEFRPHVVHLTGHGKVTGGHGTFAFEDERGRTDSKDVEELVAQVVRGSTVRCVVLNGCQTAQAAVAGLCQGLVTAGVPLAVGWSASVADDRATAFVETFYNFLLRSDPVPAAATHAREALRRKGQVRHATGQLQDATFALPQVYCSSAGSSLFDASAPSKPYTGPRTEPVLLGDGIKGLREGFVGRRRQLQQLVPAFRDGETTFAVITGLGGAGKSTLATRAANHLERAGFRILPVCTATGSSPAECARGTLVKLIDTLDNAFLKEGRKDLHQFLTDKDLPQERRLQLAIDGLDELRLALVIDNFEDALDLETRRIADPELVGLYTYLAAHLTRGSRVLVTCRYLPAETPADLVTIQHLPLPDLEEYNFRKFLRRDPVVEDRMRRGDLSEEMVGKLYRTLGGTPGFLDNVRRILRTAAADDLTEDLDAITAGEDQEGETPGPLREQQEHYYQRLVATRLYAALAPEAQTVAARLALSELPLPLDAVRLISLLNDDQARRSVEEGVAYGLLQEFREANLPTLYHPPGLLRAWLRGGGRLPQPDGQHVHAQLATFWRSCFEGNGEAQLRVSLEAELLACRLHAQRASDGTTFQWATVRLARLLQRQAEFRLALELLAEIPDGERTTDCLLALVSVEDSLAEWHLARKHLARALATQKDDTAEKALTLHNLASIDLNEGAYPAAREKLEQSQRIDQAIGDRAGEAATWHSLASIDLREGAYSAAREKLEQSLRIMQAIGHRAGEAATWHQLATIDLHEGAYPAARQKLEQSLRINQAIGDRAGEAATWHELATIDVNEGAYPAARQKFEQALRMRQAIGDRAGEAATWHNLAMIDLNEGAYPAARQKLERSLRINRAIGDRAAEAAAWHGLASIDLNEGAYPAARQKFEQALRMRQAIGDRAGEAPTWHNLASIDLREGAYSAARQKFEQALRMRQAIRDRAGEAVTWAQLGFLAIQTDQAPRGVRLVALCYLIDQAIGHGDTNRAFRHLSAACHQLGYDQDQLDAMLAEAANAYQSDRGRTLLAQAFPGSEEPEKKDARPTSNPPP